MLTKLKEWSTQKRRYKYCPKCGTALKKESITIIANPMTGNPIEEKVEMFCDNGACHGFYISWTKRINNNV